LTNDLIDNDDILEIFERFIDDAMIDAIVVETNRRGEQLSEAPGIIDIVYYFILFRFKIY